MDSLKLKAQFSIFSKKRATWSSSSSKASHSPKPRYIRSFSYNIYKKELVVSQKSKQLRTQLNRGRLRSGKSRGRSDRDVSVPRPSSPAGPLAWRGAGNTRRWSPPPLSPSTPHTFFSSKKREIDPPLLRSLVPSPLLRSSSTCKKREDLLCFPVPFPLLIFRSFPSSTTWKKRRNSSVPNSILLPVPSGSKNYQLETTLFPPKNSVPRFHPLLIIQCRYVHTKQVIQKIWPEER